MKSVAKGDTIILHSAFCLLHCRHRRRNDQFQGTSKNSVLMIGARNFVGTKGPSQSQKRVFRGALQFIVHFGRAARPRAAAHKIHRILCHCEEVQRTDVAISRHKRLLRSYFSVGCTRRLPRPNGLAMTRCGIQCAAARVEPPYSGCAINTNFAPCFFVF